MLSTRRCTRGFFRSPWPVPCCLAGRSLLFPAGARHGTSAAAAGRPVWQRPLRRIFGAETLLRRIRPPLPVRLPSTGRRSGARGFGQPRPRPSGLPRGTSRSGLSPLCVPRLWSLGRWSPSPRGPPAVLGVLPLGPGGMGPGCDMPRVPRVPADAAIALCRGVGVGGACGTPPGSPVGGSPPGSPSAARGGASGGGPGSSRSRSPIRRPLLSGPGGALLRASGIASQEDLAYWWSPEAEVRVWAASHAESHVEEIVGDL